MRLLSKQRSMKVSGSIAGSSDPAAPAAQPERQAEENMTAPIFKRVDCLSIPVSNLDAALAFYSAKLGHELIWHSNTAAGLRLPGSNAELVLHNGR
jgi:hypothetical protein